MQRLAARARFSICLVFARERGFLGPLGVAIVDAFSDFPCPHAGLDRSKRLTFMQACRGESALDLPPNSCIPTFFFSVHPRSNRAARVTLPHSQSRSSRPSAKRSACMLVHTPHTHTVCNDFLQSPIQRDHGEDSSEAVRWWSR
jgi:hypothetical protein